MIDILLFAIRGLAIWFIAAPVLTALHELGHAGAALLLTRGDVRVWVGSWKREPAHGIGRLGFSVTPNAGFTGFYTFDAGDYSRARRAAIIVAGPLMSLAITACAFGFGLAGPIADTWLAENLIVVVGYPAIVQLLSTAIPWTYPASWGEYAGMPSDGLRLVRLLRTAGS